MKRDSKERCYLSAVILIAGILLMWEGTQARADEPVEWCGTYVNWAAKVGNQRAVADGACPTYGRCDRPSVRDSWIPKPCTSIVRIRVKLNIFCYDDGTNCYETPSDVAAQMAQLNADYAPYRVQFTWDTQYINNSTYRELSTLEERDAMKNAYADNPARQINVYVVDIVYDPSLRGEGIWPWDPDSRTNMGGIIIDHIFFGAERNVLTHEVGHNLGLWHTFHGTSEVNQCSACWERADGVNADTTGDFASDTPPQPGLCGSTQPPAGVDTCSQPDTTPWPPGQPENYMTYSDCRTLFTLKQAGRMHCWIHDVLMGWVACTSNGECDDRSECTEEACNNGFCERSPTADNTACTSGVCCGGWCVCASDGDCEDGVACTTHACVNPGTCDAYCENTGPACEPVTPDGCCDPRCTPCSDIDCRSANELAGSTCRDCIDNDCDGLADCEDVADCVSDLACRCTDIDGIGGNSPLVCVDWDGADPPEAPTNFFFDFGPDPNNPTVPNVTFVTGNNGWKVWSQVNAADATPANLGHVKIDQSLPPTANVSVTIAHGSSHGAANLASVALVNAGFTGQSNLSGGSIAGNLEDDLVLQESDGQGGVGSFTIGGNVLGNITIPKVDMLQVSGAVSSNSTITLMGFVGDKHAEFNTTAGVFAGNLSLPNGVPYGAGVTVYGELANGAVVDFSQGELTGLLRFYGGADAQSVISVGALDGRFELHSASYSGTATFASVEPRGRITIADAALDGTIHVIGDCRKSLEINGGSFGPGGVISIDGSLTGNGSLYFAPETGGVSGDILIGQNCNGSVSVSGDINGNVTVSGELNGSISVAGDISGNVTVFGEFNGDICAANISATAPLPENISIPNFGVGGTICGEPPACDPGSQAAIVDWKSVVTHGASNTIGLVVPSDATFSEPRNGGVTKLRVSFSSPIDPSSVSPSNVTVCGNDVNGQPVNLSWITVTTSVLSDNMVVDVNFSPKLPNFARYRVRLSGVKDLGCHTITENNERIFTSLFCDATGDRRVTATDVSGVRSLEGTGPPVDPNAPNGTQQVRSDVDNDDDDDVDDTDLVRGEVGKDARFIPDPSCP